jgi:hypothetical protein
MKITSYQVKILGAFYCYANKKFSFKSAVGPSQDEYGLVTSDSQNKVSLLQRALLSAVRLTMVACLLMLKRFLVNSTRIFFSPSLVRQAIKHLETKTTGGPDGIPPIFLINCVTSSLIHFPYFSHIVLTTVYFRIFG